MFCPQIFDFIWASGKNGYDSPRGTSPVELLCAEAAPPADVHGAGFG